MLEASADLGAQAAGPAARRPAARVAGGRGRVDLHLLADARRLHHAALVSSTQFIGNVVYINVGVANNLPFAAAFATVPVAVMVVYLLLARRAGAFESL